VSTCNVYLENIETLEFNFWE